MPSIIVQHKTDHITEKKPFKRDIFWYDPALKKMEKFNCTEIIWKYQYDHRTNNYRLLPSPITHDVGTITNKINKEAIKEWFANYRIYGQSDMEAVEISSNAQQTIFSVPEKEVDSFTYLLERYGFKYKIDS